MRKIKVVVLLVRQLQHGFTKNAKVSPNLTVTHIVSQWCHVRYTLVTFEVVGVPCSGPLHFSNIADYVYDFCRS